MQSLEALIVLLQANSGNTDPLVTNTECSFYHYNSATYTIGFDAQNPSIISTMHEFAHWLFGRSELDACRFSVWLFKEGFPKSYAKLKPQGHMLVKNQV